ncbi:MarC family protein [Nigerium sp.]|uniref:MarC family protein n=1 Tax=Nigerium sp. TaxID=2042655 RepID=UPI0032214FDB
MNPTLFVQAFGGLFAIMNPFVALPMFLALTTGYDLRRQRTTAVRVALFSVLMTAVIIASGSAVLTFFGVSVNDFRVAGGIVLLMIALGMLNGGSAAHSGSADERKHQEAQAGQGDVAFYPLTFPMLVGPGTITTIIVFTGHVDSVAGYVAVSAAALATIAVLFVVLWFAPAIGHHLGQTLRTIMTRLMGMILAGIAVSMVVAGLAALLPGLAR